MARRRRSKGLETSIALIVFSILFAGMAGVGVFLYTQHKAQANFDSDTLCPLDRDPIRTAILIDASDPVTDAQLQRIEGELTTIISQLQLHEWLGIYILNEENRFLPKPSIGKCYPGGKNQANPLFQNPAQLEAALQRNFIAPLATALREIASTRTNQKTSPIMEMINAVANDRSYYSNEPRKLIIISDMLHNTAEYSHYRDEPDFASFANTEYAVQFLDNQLPEVEVKILHLRRAKDRDKHKRKYITFWEEYFDAVGARLTQVQAL